jgi:hypothetical protein
MLSIVSGRSLGGAVHLIIIDFSVRFAVEFWIAGCWGNSDYPLQIQNVLRGRRSRRREIAGPNQAPFDRGAAPLRSRSRMTSPEPMIGCGRPVLLVYCSTCHADGRTLSSL